MKRLGFVILSALTLVGCSQKVDISVFPKWEEGEMEIHHIYTGRGEANFMIFPDGTTMLVDAGDWDPTPKQYDKMTPLLPDSSRRAGEWIARYIERVNPNKTAVDYLIVSHFHNDHTGDCTIPELQKTEGCQPDYIQVGITEVGKTIRFQKAFDRGYPDYDYPLPIKDLDVDNYRAFLKGQQEKFGLQQERFEVGRCNQIALLKKPEKYREIFSIQNLSANGEVWTGKEGKNIRYYDLNEKNLANWQNENTKSIAMRITYGPFRYYAGGDVSGTLLDERDSLFQIEAKVAEVCGPVDVCKANHHAYLDAMSDEFIRKVKARNYIVPVWDLEHIQPSVIDRMSSTDLYPGERTIHFTHLPDLKREQLLAENKMQSVCQQSGHVVVKVYDHGKQYKIYVLSTENESMTVRAVYGPFEVSEISI